MTDRPEQRARGLSDRLSNRAERRGPHRRPCEDDATRPARPPYERPLQRRRPGSVRHGCGAGVARWEFSRLGGLGRAHRAAPAESRSACHRGDCLAVAVGRALEPAARERTDELERRRRRRRLAGLAEAASEPAILLREFGRGDTPAADAVEEIARLVGQYVDSTPGLVVVWIDELDRCPPEYALGWPRANPTTPRASKTSSRPWNCPGPWHPHTHDRVVPRTARRPSRTARRCALPSPPARLAILSFQPRSPVIGAAGRGLLEFSRDRGEVL